MALYILFPSWDNGHFLSGLQNVYLHVTVAIIKLVLVFIYFEKLCPD